MIQAFEMYRSRFKINFSFDFQNVKKMKKKIMTAAASALFLIN